MKSVLLANFCDCPENLHFEQAFIRAFKGRPGISLDIVHDFQFAYPFIKKSPPPGGRRVRYTAPADLKRELRGSYDLLAALDFPKRKTCAAPFLRLLGELPCAEKIFIANHLLPMPGHNPTADIIRKLGLLSVMDRAFILEFDDPALWAGLGLKAGRMLKRGYAVDCLYYSPAPAAPGDGVFSAGSAGRDFLKLARAAGRAGAALTIFTDTALPPFEAAPGTPVLAAPLAENLPRLRAAVREAGAVAIPVTDGHINGAAGNTIAFIAMACGRPVVIRRTPYLERFIKDGETGFFYESLTVQELSRQLKRALSLGPAASRLLSKAARAAVLEKASLDAFTESFRDKFVLIK